MYKINTIKKLNNYNNIDLLIKIWYKTFSITFDVDMFFIINFQLFPN